MHPVHLDALRRRQALLCSAIALGAVGIATILGALAALLVIAWGTLMPPAREIAPQGAMAGERAALTSRPLTRPTITGEA